MSDFTPTDEQIACVDLFRSGESMVVEAGAGTGKTSTLVLLAESDARRGQYLAFNKSIVVEAGRKLPDNCEASTVHSLAFRAVGREYQSRLRGPRMKGYEMAAILGLDPYVVTYGSQKKTLAAGFLAGVVMKSIGRFCQTADETPDVSHVPYLDGIDIPNADGTRTYRHNDALREQLAPSLDAAWREIVKKDGKLPFKHEHYLKLWQLQHPRIAADVIFFDEAQDANPIMAAIVAEQEHAQRVYVGDSCQAIYEFTGAVNAMAEFDTTHRRYLTQSFRFGPAIADRANLVLSNLGAPLRLSGTPAIRSSVETLGNPRCILTRTNARAVTTLLGAMQAGRKPHLVGGGAEIASFARAARDLQERGSTGHPELACFDSWGEVVDYVAHDPNGSDLKLLVDLVDDFGIETILGALDANVQENRADVIVSTAHKAKGREWESVQITADFPPKITGPTDLRLLYVAATRAQGKLDDSGVRYLYE